MEIDLLVSGYGGGDTPSISLTKFDDKLRSWDVTWNSYIRASSFLSESAGLLFGITEREGCCCVYMYKESVNGYEFLDLIGLECGQLCHVQYLPKNKLLIGSSYEEGVLFSVEVNGEKFGDVKDYIITDGNLEGESRIHCAITSQGEEYLFATNIATDVIYKYHLVSKKLVEVDVLKLPAGSGPRHLVVDDNREMLYVNTEYSNKIIGIRFDEVNLSICQIISTLPDTYTQESSGSSICMSDDGRFIYAANRGHDSIAIFAIDNWGILECNGYIHCCGHWPRHIALIGSGNYMAIANQFSNRVVILKRDAINGLLGDKVKELEIEKPSFVDSINRHI